MNRSLPSPQSKLRVVCAVVCLVVVSAMAVVQGVHLCGMDYGPDRAMSGHSSDRPDTICPICCSTPVGHGAPVIQTEALCLNESEAVVSVEIGQNRSVALLDLFTRPPPSAS